MNQLDVIQQPLFIPGKRHFKMRPKFCNNGSAIQSSGASSHHKHSLSTPMNSINNTNYNKNNGGNNGVFPVPTPLACSSRFRSQSTTSMGGEMTIVLVGGKRQPFVVNRRLLCAVSPFFRHQLQQKMHSSPSPSPSLPVPSSSLPSLRSQSAMSFASSSSFSSCTATPRTLQTTFYTYKPITLWLPGESTTMFGLFVEWLHARSSFRSFLDDAAALAQSTSDEATQLLHWALIRLHLFAAHLDLPVLQDLAMDAIQDLYLRCDWDIAPSVIAYLYTRCEAEQAVRLRRWAVAMVAFSLTVAWHVTHEQKQQQQEEEDAEVDEAELHRRNQNERAGSGGSRSRSPREAAEAAAAAPYRVHQRTKSSSSSSSSSPVCDPARLHSMLDALPEFATDYAVHVGSMRSAGLDMRFKNPQLRIPANTLRNEKRVFGFRECSFHSHRAAVGQGPCPHASSGLRAADTGSMLDLDPWDETASTLTTTMTNTHEQVLSEEAEDDDDSDDDTRQWEKEWADDYLDYEPSDYSYVPTTSLRPMPSLEPPRLPPKSLAQQAKARDSVRLLLKSKFGTTTVS